jgi:hypothetical protein
MMLHLQPPPQTCLPHARVVVYSSAVRNTSRPSPEHILGLVAVPKPLLLPCTATFLGAPASHFRHQTAFQSP